MVQRKYLVTDSSGGKTALSFIGRNRKIILRSREKNKNNKVKKSFP